MPERRTPSVFARPRWTARDAREVLDAFERSRKSVPAFAAEHGLDAQRLYLWRRRLGEAEPTRFEEVIVHRPTVPSAVTMDAFEVSLPSGEIVRVPASFDAHALTRLLDVLARRRAC